MDETQELGDRKHDWPKNTFTHKFGPWMPHSRNKIYRICVDRECGFYETKDAK